MLPGFGIYVGLTGKVQHSRLYSCLLSEFTDDQTEMIKETVVEAIAGTIMAMIAELTGDWVGD